jgi:hypothetical protein
MEYDTVKFGMLIEKDEDNQVTGRGSLSPTCHLTYSCKYDTHAVNEPLTTHSNI